MNTKPRVIAQRVQGQPTSDGDGVKLTRYIGTQAVDMLDPFLLLDCFSSDTPDDYIRGFPSHPHRGFETVTYLIAGKMRHKDNAGNEGVIEPGGVQWMSAGRGIIHSEMPEQIDGLLKGFQLWVNLPSSEKMKAPAYQEFVPAQVPLEQRDSGTQVRVVAGQTNLGTHGAVRNIGVSPTYLDVQLAAQDEFVQNLGFDHHALVLVIEGQIQLGPNAELVRSGELVILSQGDQVSWQSPSPSRCLLIAGQAIKQPVARGGPFVMNTQAELMQAFQDYRNGCF
jgi:hypothetical protein